MPTILAAAPVSRAPIRTRSGGRTPALGITFERAFRQLGATDEADWVLVKHAAYLQILDNQHAVARQTLKRLIASGTGAGVAPQASRQKLLFYAHRYLGISYQRDQPARLAKAHKSFQGAQQIVASYAGEPRDRQEMEARLLGNLGNLELAFGRVRNAVALYHRSLRLFEELEDEEHAGIEHLHIGKALVLGRGRGMRDAFQHLHAAELIAARLGWLEGQGRVAEQYALGHLEFSQVERSIVGQHKHLAEAERAARRALAAFQRMRSERWCGRIHTLLDDIERRMPARRRTA